MLELMEPLQMLQAVGQSFPQTEHHGSSGGKTETMRSFHHFKPLVGITFVRVFLSYFVHQYFRTSTGNGVQSSALQASQHLFNTQMKNL